MKKIDPAVLIPTIIRATLWFLLAVGLLSAFNLIYSMFVSETPCVANGEVYTPYSLFVGYGLMVLAPTIPARFGKPTFFGGCSVTVLTAMFGIGVSLFGSQPCPLTPNDGLLWGFFLALSGVIILFYLSLLRYIEG